MNCAYILVADDHPVIASALQKFLGRRPGFVIHPAVANSTELFASLDRLPVDLLIADYIMPGGRYGDGLAMLKRVRCKYPDIRIAVFTGLDCPTIFAALEANHVESISSKRDSLEELMIAAECALKGSRYRSPSVRDLLSTPERQGKTHAGRRLSAREAEVLRMYLAGQSIAHIATTLNRSPKTVSNQKRAAMLKLRCKNDAELFRSQSIGGIGALRM